MQISYFKQKQKEILCAFTKRINISYRFATTINHVMHEVYPAFILGVGDSSEILQLPIGNTHAPQ